MRSRAGAWLAGALAGMALVPSAAVASPQALIQDCTTNGRIVGHYSAGDYSQALANLPTDIAEYSDCADVIRRAQLAAAAAGGGSGSSPSGSVSTRSATLPAAGSAASAAAAVNPRQDPLGSAAPAERAAVAAARSGGASPVEIGGGLLRPGVVAARTSSIFNALPTPLLIALAGLALVALAVLGRFARDLVRTRRPG
ncbi:MAG: hypothetical protein ACR2KV_13495 [Solirubrobacteraceae bacterium]